MQMANLKSTYFKYGDDFYKQKFGTAMGSPVSVVVTNLYMDDFETMAITTFDDGFKFWVHYVDDIFCIVKKTV